MKKTREMLIILLAAFALTGCIAVDDFDTAWKNGVVDPALEGRWVMTPAPGMDDQQPRERYFTFVKAADHYNLVSEQNDSGDSILVKTLNAGGRSFLMLYEPKEDPEAAKAEPPSGDLWRYEVSGSHIKFTRLSEKEAENIEKITGSLVRSVKVGEARQFGIKKLDEKAVKALAKIADDSSLWEVWATGEKAPSAKN